MNKPKNFSFVCTTSSSFSLVLCSKCLLVSGGGVPVLFKVSIDIFSEGRGLKVPHHVHTSVGTTLRHDHGGSKILSVDGFWGRGLEFQCNTIPTGKRVTGEKKSGWGQGVGTDGKTLPPTKVPLRPWGSGKKHIRCNYSLSLFFEILWMPRQWFTYPSLLNTTPGPTLVWVLNRKHGSI